MSAPLSRLLSQHAIIPTCASTRVLHAPLVFLPSPCIFLLLLIFFKLLSLSSLSPQSPLPRHFFHPFDLLRLLSSKQLKVQVQSHETSRKFSIRTFNFVILRRIPVPVAGLRAFTSYPVVRCFSCSCENKTNFGFDFEALVVFFLYGHKRREISHGDL